MRNQSLNIYLMAILMLFAFTITPSSTAHANWPFGKTEQMDYTDFNAADNLFKAGYYDRALARINKFLSDYPDDIGGLMLKAWCMLKLDRHQEGKDIIDDVLKEDPENLDALVATGVYFRMLGDNEQALNYYEKVLAIDPNDPYALSSIVTVALLNCEVNKAVDYGERAVKGADDDAVINANLAVAYHFDGQIEKRDEYTEKAKRLQYPSIESLMEIYSGGLLILPDDCDPTEEDQ